MSSQPVVRLSVEAGPDSGRSIALPAGRHHIGRSPACAVRIADPAVEPHHAVLEVSAEHCALTQLTGRWPIRVAGEARHLAPLARDVPVEIGHSRVALRSAEPPIVPGVQASPSAVRLGWAIAPGVPDHDLDASGAVAHASGEAVVADLGRPGAMVVAIRGDGAPAVVRSIVVQLARVGRAGCRLVPMLVDRAEAQWMSNLGACAAGGRAVAVVDRVAALRSAALAELRAGGDARVIVAVPADRAVPPEATALLELGPRWRGRWNPDLDATGPRTTRLHVAGCARR